MATTSTGELELRRIQRRCHKIIECVDEVMDDLVAARRRARSMMLIGELERIKDALLTCKVAAEFNLMDAGGGTDGKAHTGMG